MSKPSKHIHCHRMLLLFKIAAEQGLLFNTPPLATKHPETREKERRVWQQPLPNGNYVCGGCKKEINEEEIETWADLGNTQETFYNPEMNSTLKQKVIELLQKALTGLEKFVETWSAEIQTFSPASARLYQEKIIKDINDFLDPLYDEAIKEYKRYDFLRSFDVWFTTGRALEELHRRIQLIKAELEKIKNSKLEVVNYSSVIMEPLCDNCYEEKQVKCDWCGAKGILQGNTDEYANFYKVYDVNRKKYLCKNCYEDSSHCVECDKLLSREETFYNEHDDNGYCEKHYRQHNYDIKPIERIIDTTIKNNSMSYLPVDISQVEKTILPKILYPLRSKSFSLEAIERQTDKAKLAPELKTFLLQTAKQSNFSTMEELIKKLESQINIEKTYKEKYPNIKKFNKLPLLVDVEEENANDRDMPSFSLTIRPARSLIEYSETLFPEEGEKALDVLTKGGHHHGAMAYARIGYDKDENAYVINNLQTDADWQKLTSGSLSILLPNSPLIPAVKWWLKQFENWPAQLLDIISEIGKNMRKPVYLTNFDQQKRKWSNIPDRSRDIYERIPQQMGFDKEEVDMNVEDLGKDVYQMYRVARLIRSKKLKKM